MFRYNFTKIDQTFILYFAEDGAVYDLTGDYASAEEARAQRPEWAAHIWTVTPTEFIRAAHLRHKWPVDMGFLTGSVSMFRIDQRLLKRCVLGVESNGGRWSDWSSGSEILDCYAYEGERCEHIEWILDRAVETDGDSLKIDLPLLVVQLGKCYVDDLSFYERK